MEKHPCVYILTNKPKGVLYIGATSDLPRRIWEHRRGLVNGFSRRYNTTKRVYVESCASMISALEREHRVNRWHRAWKVELIEARNPGWKDLYTEFLGSGREES